MKKIFLILCCIPLFCMAQEATTLKVNGRVLHIDKTPVFTGSITLSGTYSSLPSDAISLDQMKEKFFNELQKKGLTASEITENAIGYAMLGYEKEGTIYEIRTNSLDKMLRFTSIKSFGVQRFKSVALIVIDEEENKVLARKALENATLKAKGIAQAMGKKLGKIVRIEDYNNLVNIELEKYLNSDEPAGKRIYELNVVYTLE